MLNEDEGEWSDEDEENKLEELQTERLRFFFYSREYQQVIFNSEVLLYTKEEEEEE